MNDATRRKLTRLAELQDIIRSAEEEIETLFGTAANPSVPSGKSKGKPGPKAGAARLCSNCRQSGHIARNCNNPTPKEKTEESALPADDEEALAEAIDEEWAQGGRPSVEVAKELGITLGQFNRIIEKYKIVRP